MRGIAVVVVVVVKVVVAASGIDDAFSATVQLVRGISLRVKVSGPRFGSSSGERGGIRGNYIQNSLMRRRRYNLHLDVGSFFWFLWWSFGCGRESLLEVLVVKHAR